MRLSMRAGDAQARSLSEAETTEEPTDSDSALPVVLRQPFHGSRGTAPGPLGCWAVKKDGQPCRAAVIRGQEFCSAHSGLGVASDPSVHSPRGVRASAEARRARAELRLALGITRPNSPRSALKAAVSVNAERLASRAVGAALDPSLAPQQAVDSVLKLVEATDPQTTATAVVMGEFDPSSASLSQLLSFAGQHGISLEQPGNGSVEPSPA